MAKLKIPGDRDVLIDLGGGIVKKNTEMGKRYGVRVPATILKQIRDSLRIVSAPARRIRRLRDEADELAKEMAPDVRKLETAVRDAAQVLSKMLKDPEKLKDWGFGFETKPGKGGPPKA